MVDDAGGVHTPHVTGQAVKAGLPSPQKASWNSGRPANQLHVSLRPTKATKKTTVGSSAHSSPEGKDVADSPAGILDGMVEGMGDTMSDGADEEELDGDLEGNIEGTLAS